MWVNCPIINCYSLWSCLHGSLVWRYFLVKVAITALPHCGTHTQLEDFVGRGFWKFLNFDFQTNWQWYTRERKKSKLKPGVWPSHLGGWSYPRLPWEGCGERRGGKRRWGILIKAKNLPFFETLTLLQNYTFDHSLSLFILPFPIHFYIIKWVKVRVAWGPPNVQQKCVQSCGRWCPSPWIWQAHRRRVWSSASHITPPFPCNLGQVSISTTGAGNIT